APNCRRAILSNAASPSPAISASTPITTALSKNSIAAAELWNLFMSNRPSPPLTSVMTPREIVSELDKYIVGQNQAKRAVAIALRNRWRRMQLDERLRDEITPK